MGASASASNTGGFENPNYTQVPNDFFEMAKDMKESEVRVVLAMMRQIFGYHKSQSVLSISTLAKLTGLSRQGVANGTAAAKERGIVRQVGVTSDGTIWELVVNEVDYPSQLSRLGVVNEVGTYKERKKINKEINIERHEMQPEQHEEAMAYLESLDPQEISSLAGQYPVLQGLGLSEWPYWLYEIIPFNQGLSEKARNTPVQDLSAVQHFGDEEVIRIVNAFHKLWGVPVPTSAKYDKARVNDWRNGAKQIASVCAGHDPIQVMGAFKKWREVVDPQEDIRFSRPNSIVNMLGSYLPQYKPASDQPAILDDDGNPVFYG